MSAFRVLLMLAVLSFRACATVFFAMDTGTVDDRHKSAAEQVSLVQEIGFSGIGPMLSTPEALREMIRAADGKQVLIPAVYASLDLDVTAEPGPVIRDAIRQLKGRGSILWLSIQSPSHKVSDPALDARVVPILRALAADAGAHGVRVALYPHANMWLETVEDAMRLADQVNDPNLGVCFNLCHWLKVDAVDLDDSLRRAAPRLFVVTIQGADDGGKDWSTLIQPLGEGTYDVGALLAKLDKLGFKGPIGLQHYGIRGDARVNLGKSMDAWRRLAGEPAPFGPVPSPAQLAWHGLERFAFIHFTTNTFTGKEWGYGDEDPSIFHPTAFDAGQIVGNLADCGFKGVILTCKHHDGFCLWPTKTTDHNIRRSPWKDGEGDMVREFAEAARLSGIGFGIYLSPWDRNHPDYGTPRYVEVYREQLRELLTGYGPVFEVWHDGANGGDGYYGGKRERRSIDQRTYYQWPLAWRMVRELQPEAVIFSDVGPDVRWVGNESGRAPYPSWAAFNPVGPDGGEAAPGFCRSQEGSPDGRFWIPAETNVSIRPGWFWHEHENDKVRSPKNLLDRYFESVGHGTTFLLNVPPDRRGLIHENDLSSLREFKQALDRMFSRNLASGASATADVTRGRGFEAACAVDEDKSTFWAAPDDARSATLEIKLPEARRFSVFEMREPIRLGQRIHRFSVEVSKQGRWVEWIPGGSSVGAQVLLRGQPVTTDAVRVRILESAACPCVSGIRLWLEPENVRDAGPGTKNAQLPKTGWKVASSAGDAALAVDGNPATEWSAEAGASVTIDLGLMEQPAAFTVLAKPDGAPDSRVVRFRLEWSVDGNTWSAPVEGEFGNQRANPTEQRISFPPEARMRQIRFTAVRPLEGSLVRVAEFGVVPKGWE